MADKKLTLAKFYVRLHAVRVLLREYNIVKVSSLSFFYIIHRYKANLTIAR